MGKEKLSLLIGVIFIIFILGFVSAIPQDGSGIYSGQCTGSRQISRNNEVLEASSDWNFQYSGSLNQWNGEGDYEKVMSGHSEYSGVDYTKYETVTEVWNEEDGHEVCSSWRRVDSAGNEDTGEETCFLYDSGYAVDQILTMIQGDVNVVHEEFGSECNGSVMTYKDSIDYPYGYFDYLDEQGSWYFDKAECTYTIGFCNPVYPVVSEISIDLLLCRDKCVSAYSEEAKNISYTEIFPPVLNCSFSVEDEDSDDGDIISVDIKFKKGEDSSSEVFYQESKQCQNKKECSLILQKSETSSIKPGDSVWCEATPTDKDGNKGDSGGWSIVMPQIDLFIDNVNFFNSINFAPLTREGAIPILVREKPFGVKFCPSFSSDLQSLTKLDIPLEYSLKFNNNVEINIDSPDDLEIYKSKEELRNKITEEIINKGSTGAVEEEIFKLKNIKKGKDCIVKLGLKQQEIVPESAIFWYKLEIDSDGNIPESDEENNIKQGAIFSPESKSLSLQYHTIILEDSDTGELVPAKETIYEDIDGNVIVTQEQIVSKGITNTKQGYEFIRRVFPIDSKKLWIYGLGDREDERIPQVFRDIVQKIHSSLKIQVDNLEEIHKPFIFDNLTEEEFIQEEEKALQKADDARRKILEELRPFAKELDEGKLSEKNHEIIVVGIVPRDALFIKHEGRLITVSGLAYSKFNVVLISYDADFGTLAHEVGHCAGLYLSPERELYDSVPEYGDIASDGWCLDPETGESCGGFFGNAIVNIWDEKSTGMQNRYSLKDVWEGDVPSGKIKDKIDMGKRYFDFMGSASEYNEKSNIWVDFPSYKKLAGKYTSWIAD